jgi:outer membrane immunogenic protein
MKGFLLGATSIIVLGMAVPASAADLAARPYTKAPPMVAAAVYDWSGFYIGGNGGGGWSHSCWDLVGTAGAGTLAAPLAEGCNNASGATAGGQIGYRWQSSTWVFGLEGQGNWADLKGSNVSLFFPGFANKSGIDAFGLFTGQIGYAWDNVLLYAKGGLAVTANTYSVSTSPGNVLAGTAPDETRWGGAIGAGLEYGISSNWTAGVEYDHLFMGTRSASFADPNGVFLGTDNIRQDVDLVTVRVNYRWGGPAISKY